MTARFSLELANDAKGVVSDLIAKTGLRTQTDVFENALALLTWAVREVGRGRTIASLDEATKQYAELHMPALMGVRNVSRREDPGASRREDNDSSRHRDLALADK